MNLKSRPNLDQRSFQAERSRHTKAAVKAAAAAAELAD